MTVATGVTSGVVLALEIAHVRVLSYATDPRLVYGAIAVAMAAMGAASITVALRPSLVRGDVRPRVALVTMAFSAAIVGSSALFAHVAPWFDASSAAAVI
ncbi:MAG: hypothetical protein IT379_07405, partial [Deltaproteobacteria bacterium]|nr:hypothetical protein [Deltaproteobacteria bacterium]